MDLRSVSAVILGLMVALGVVWAAAGSGGGRSPALAATEKPSPSETPVPAAPASDRELLYLRFPGCPGCERNLAGIRKVSEARELLSIGDVLAEENEALAEAVFRGEVAHGAVLRIGNKVLWSAPCPAVDAQALEAAILNR